MERLLATPITELEGAMRFRLKRQAVLASNLAHADTPGYRRVDIVPFRDALERATEMRRSDPGHLSAGGDGVRVVRGPRGSRPDGSGVDRDRETLEVSRNAGAFTKQANILARLFVLARIAATGEAR